MEAEFRNALPSSLLTLVDEIETAARAEIIVERDSPERKGLTMRSRMTWGRNRSIAIKCSEGPEQTTAAYSDPYAMFCHELLHLRRYLVERVPIVCRVGGMSDSADLPMRFFTAIGIEEILEHAIIEPSLKKYGFKSPLNHSIMEFWSGVPGPREADVAPKWNLFGVEVPGALVLEGGTIPTMRWLCMREWVAVQFATNNVGVHRRAERVMERFGMLERAESFTGNLAWLSSSPDQVKAKEGMSLAACMAFHIWPSAMALSYYDDSGCRWEKPIPGRFTVPGRNGSSRVFEW